MNTSEENSQTLKIAFFPFLAHGHMIPTLDMAKLFSLRGAKATILTTPLNAPFFSNSVQLSENSNTQIEINTIKFPCQEAGLPDGFENIDQITNDYKGQEIVDKFFKATTMMKGDLEKFLEEIRPDCLVSDMFFPWTTESAAKYGIPRLVFHGSSFFAMCADECLRLHAPHKSVSSDSESFVVPELPGEIQLTRNQLAEMTRSDKKEEEVQENEIDRMIKEAVESQTNCYGVIFNSFYELEPSYVDFYRDVLKKRAWHIGPVSLLNQGIREKSVRGKNSTVDEHECLKWMESKKPGSVIYVCFGSTAKFTDAQLMEIAVGLERSGQDFIWVVRIENKKEEEKESWLIDGFEQRTRGKGLIIRGWAPQLLILDHAAVGGFVTHCGWNSVLEGIAAGVPMVTWPVFAEQFYNEKLVTQVLKIGVSVGAEKLVEVVGDFVMRDKVEAALREVMVGEEAEERRKRAKGLAEMAGRAVEKGGSSHSDLTRLMEGLRVGG